MAFLFHLVVRDPFIAHLPRSLYQRLARFQYFDWGQYFRQHYFVVVFSIMLGAATHLVWDSLTHGRDQLVEQYTWLRPYVHALARTLGMAESRAARPARRADSTRLTNPLRCASPGVWAPRR